MKKEQCEKRDPETIRHALVHLAKVRGYAYTLPEDEKAFRDGLTDEEKAIIEGEKFVCPRWPGEKVKPDDLCMMEYKCYDDCPNKEKNP